MNYFETSDICLAAFLNLYFPVDSLDKKDISKVIFFFKSSPNLNRLIENYWKRDIKVNPQEFFTSLKIIKTRLYQD